MSLQWTVKTSSFLDRPEVIRHLNAFERRWLFRMGSFTRTAARQSIRKRKAISKPGNPPTNRTGLLRNSIAFGMAPGGQSVVIGALPRGKRNADVIEHGGRVYRKDAKGKRRAMNYRARPFMRPALRKMATDLQRKYPNELPKMFKATGGLV